MLCLSFLAIILVHLADCDIYLHSLRGSNNRLNENSANRKNANRVFDSQVSKKDTLPLKLCCVQQNLTSGKSVVVLSNQYNLLCNATVLNLSMGYESDRSNYYCHDCSTRVEILVFVIENRIEKNCLCRS